MAPKGFKKNQNFNKNPDDILDYFPDFLIIMLTYIYFKYLDKISAFNFKFTNTIIITEI